MVALLWIASMFVVLHAVDAWYTLLKEILHHTEITSTLVPTHIVELDRFPTLVLLHQKPTLVITPIPMETLHVHHQLHQQLTGGSNQIAGALTVVHVLPLVVIHALAHSLLQDQTVYNQQLAETQLGTTLLFAQEMVSVLAKMFANATHCTEDQTASYSTLEEL